METGCGLADFISDDDDVHVPVADNCLYTYLYMCIHALVRVDDTEVWVLCARCEPITGDF